MVGDHLGSTSITTDSSDVKSVVNGVTIYFVGGYYEKKGAEITKYYFAGASRVAMRKTIVPQTDTLTYLLGDHLGSTSLAIDSSTGNIVETRYKPWGEVRYTSQDLTLPTRYTFTGQYSHMDDSATDLGAAGFGLMFYNARWYDPALGRFAQADTVVPGGVQGFDRYAYVNNSPVMYVDPTGHFSVTQIMSYISGRCATSTGYDSETGEGTQAYSNCISSTYAAWHADTNWWNMLLDAQVGTILYGSISFGNDTTVFTATFTWDDSNSTFGIKFNSNYPHTGISLLTIHQGNTTFNNRSIRNLPVSITWMGSVTPIRGVSPRYWKWFYRTGYEQTSNSVTPQWVEDLIGYPIEEAVGLGIAWASKAIWGGCGASGLAYLGCAILGTLAVNGAIDALDLEVGDIHIQNGPLYFNFNLQGDSWSLEHIYYVP